MNKLYEKTTSKPLLNIIIFILLFVVCLVFKPLISVNYDMNDYLPEDSSSTISLDVMESEFDGGIPNARVMIGNVTLAEAMEYKEKMLAVEGVTDVIWLDDSISLEVPLEMQDTDVVESYYKDGNAIFTVTINENLRSEAVSEIRTIIGEDNAMTGSAVSSAVATESTVSEISKITVAAILFVLLILLLTTTSWAEPFVILIGLGIAVIINEGSNIIFGEISFVTNAAGTILQLAVSLDYSVFLLHRFQECRKTNPDVKAAMVEALSKSTNSILSSGLTTVIGFLALCLMRFGIGPDLGLALAKGISISLLTVFVFMPSLILLTYKVVDKTQHRPFLPKFDKFGKAVTKIMLPMVCIFAVIIAPCYLASNSNSFYYGSSHIFGTETQLGSDTEKIENVFGKSDTYVLLVPNGDFSTQKKLSAELKNLSQVSDIISYVDTVGAEIPTAYLDDETYSKLISENYSRMVISVDADFEGEETFTLVENIREIAQQYYPDKYYLAGEGVSTYDLMNTVTSDMIKVNLIAIAAVFIVLLLTMKSLTLPVILVASIETAIWFNLSIPYFAGNTIFYIAYLIISSVQLGATVDYAILLTDRYLENRRELPKKQAVKKTVSSVAVSILTSASVLTIVGFLLGKISTHGLLSQLGYFIGKGTLCSLGIVLLVLPGLLYVFDRFIGKTTLNSCFFKEEK